ncbi:MAG: ABC transporter ATP-binding protein [Micromonosporaceae bacterium]|nr:ABC transporter ATP-binding protein [Micromonosporaceae bacterium]
MTPPSSAPSSAPSPARGPATGPALGSTLAIEVSGLVVDCGGTRILRGVDLDVTRGEWVTVIGPNGAGKSTMLRAIGGALPSSGAITLFGTPLGSLSRTARARLVATVAQHPIVPPGIGVLDYVLLGRTPYIPPLGRESRQDLEVVSATLRRLDLARFASRALETLSGGERQRVFLARALAQEPQVLLLDEPTTALDIGHQQDMLELVDELRAAEQITVLATTHELSIAGEYADRLVLVAAGQIVAAGPPEQVLTADLLAKHYGARVRVIDGENGPLVVPVRATTRRGPPATGQP